MNKINGIKTYIIVERKEDEEYLNVVSDKNKIIKPNKKVSLT